MSAEASASAPPEPGAGGRHAALHAWANSVGRHVRLGTVVLVVLTVLAVSALLAVLADVGVDQIGRAFARAEPGLVLASLELTDEAAPAAEHNRHYRRAADRLIALPQVRDAALASPTFGSNRAIGLRVQGFDSLPDLPGGGPYYFAVSPGYAAAMGLDLLDGRPLEETDREGGAPVALLRIEGFADQVRYRTGALRDRLGMEADSLDAGASAELWRGVRDAGPLHGSEVVVRLSARPSLLPQVAEALGPVTLLADWGGGLVWAGTDAARGAALLARARSFVEGHGGHATLWKAPTRMRGEGRVFQPEAAPIAALSAGLRAQFDPKGRLNPGLMA